MAVVTCVVGGVSASASRMIAGICPTAEPRAKGTNAIGRFSFSTKVRASVASRPAVYSPSLPPMVSRAIQRRSEAMTSRVVTGWPSWNFSPGRRVKVQARPSGEVEKLSSISGFGWRCSSQAKSVS